MDEYKNIFNAILEKKELIEQTLVMEGKKEAEIMYNDVIEWLKNNYKIERK